MQFAILGPLEVTAHGQPVRIGGARVRAVLAMLVLRAGRVTSAEALTEALWPGLDPDRASANLQVRISQLRTALRYAGETERVTTTSPGYLLRVSTAEVDSLRFGELVAEARMLLGQGDPRSASARLEDALGLWRGEPLADLADAAWARGEVARLTEARLAALELRADARLACGAAGELVVELDALTQAHPLRERLWAQRMLALYRSGRQAEALATYHQVRTRLIDELGIEPGSELRDLEARILAQDPALDGQVHGTEVILAGQAADLDLTAGDLQVPRRNAAILGSVERRTEFGQPVPRQLPAGPRYFAGRAAELKMLDGLIDEASRAPGTVAISAISGPGGVGKTALALHWAHKVADRFPGGQLYANLRGFEPAATPAPAAHVLSGFLDGFGLPPEAIPASSSAQASLYRSLAVGRRLLIVLDNARDAEQVRPLLPGGGDCLVLVTSRSDLAGLVAAECALPLQLGGLSADEAGQLLTARLGAERLSAEPAAVADLTALCAGLPLALGVAAVRAAARHELPLSVLAAELAQGPGSLDAFETGDEATSLRAVFSWSYRALPEPAARMFRLLGLHPGPDVGAGAAASLAAITGHEARRLLAVLASESMLAETKPGRYALHDLLRTYAAEQAQQAETAAARRAAVQRMLDHYLHTASRAAFLLRGAGWQNPAAEPEPGVATEPLADKAQAMDWYQAERCVLVAIERMACEAGFDVHGWQLPWAVLPYQSSTCHWQDREVLLRLGLHAARRLADPLALSKMQLAMASQHFRSGAYAAALAQAWAASRHFRKTGDLRGQADCHAMQGLSLNRLGRLAEAQHHAEQALEMSRATGYRDTEIRALAEIGDLQAKAGNPKLGIEYCRQALALERDADDMAAAVAAALDTMAQIQLQSGDGADAIASYREALSRLRQLGDFYGEAHCLFGLGDANEAVGDRAAARQAWREALSILGEMLHPDADRVRARLRQSAE